MCAGERLAQALQPVPVDDLRRIERTLAGRVEHCSLAGNQSLAAWHAALRNVVGLMVDCQSGQGFPAEASFVGLDAATAALSGRDWAALVLEHTAAIADVEGHMLRPAVCFHLAVLAELRPAKPASDRAGSRTRDMPASARRPC